jgi:hypothetical protein
MLINGGTAVNLMSYSVFKKLGRKDNELVKTKPTINGLGGNPMEAWDVIFIELTVGSKSLATAFFVVKVTIVLFLAVIGFTPTAAFLLVCTNS